MNVIYVSSFSLKYYTMICVHLTKTRALEDGFWRTVANVNETDYATQRDIYNTIYWLNNGIDWAQIYIFIIIKNNEIKAYF